MKIFMLIAIQSFSLSLRRERVGVRVKTGNSKGLSVLFLVIAMLLMVTIGYVFSYLMPSKQKSIIFPIQSTQAFFLAQSGVEFAVRYAKDNGLGTVDGMTRSLGNGSFSLSYNSGADTLTSAGQVPTGTERRTISVSNFSQFIGENLSLDPSFSTCLTTVYDGGLGKNVHLVRFRIISSSGVTLNAFQSYWTGNPANRRIRYIRIGGTTAWGPGTYSPTAFPPASQTSFTSNQTVPPNTSTMVEVQFNDTFNLNRGPFDMYVIFYSTTGRSYNLILNSSSMLPPC